MTTLREAAQQALEALETCDAAHPSDGGQQWYDDKLVESAITALKAALAEPTVKESLKVAPAVAENATTQQQVEQTPPSEYRRGYWAGFEIGKREGRIEAEDALAEPRPIHECYGDCPTNPQTCPNPCNFEGRPRPVQDNIVDSQEKPK